MAFVAAARLPPRGDDGDRHATPALGTEPRGIQCPTAARALGGRLTAAGAVRSHGRAHCDSADSADSADSGAVIGGAVIGRAVIGGVMGLMVTGLRWRR